MISKSVICVAVLQLVLLGLVNGRSHGTQHQRHLHHIQSRPQEPIAPEHSSQSASSVLDDRGSSVLRQSLLTHKHYNSTLLHRLRSENDCGLCPSAQKITPCMCQCVNGTAADLVCGHDLTSCSQLTEVMSLPVYPVDSYFRLVIENTELGCKLEQELWGPLKFYEVLITNNRFEVLDNRAFQPFSSTLTHLDLDDNSLRNIYFATLSDTPLLTKLTLSNNAIEFLPGYSGIQLSYLDTLDVSYNKIKTILPETFAGLPMLQTLNLSNNAITSVYSDAFTIITHTVASLYIDLSNNLISSIEPGMLEGVNVCHIDLRDNLLTTLSENVFRPIIDSTAASSVFWTFNNPLECDNDFCWIATNETVSSTFQTVLCPNLDYEPVEVLSPMCRSVGSIKTSSDSKDEAKNKPRRLPAPNPDTRAKNLQESLSDTVTERSYAHLPDTTESDNRRPLSHAILPDSFREKDPQESQCRIQKRIPHARLSNTFIEEDLRENQDRVEKRFLKAHLPHTFIERDTQESQGSVQKRFPTLPSS